MEADWPKSLVFTRDGLHLNFESINDFQQWIAQERSNWNAIGSGASNWNGAVNANLNILNGVDSNPSPEALRNLVDNYRPSNGTLGRFISRIQSPMARNIAFSEITKPNSMGAQNQNHPDFIQGRTMADVYAAIGGDLVGIHQASEAAQEIKSVISEVMQLRDSDKAVSARFEALATKCETDWNAKIDGFEAKVALKAPRTFWQARADQHNALGRTARREWFWSILVLIVFIIAAGTAEFLVPLPPDLIGAVVSGITRVVLFATILAIAAWWLRQKLRDLRTHEHFSEDAAERATMIETYAALRGTGLQDADLGPILTALYRPAATGFSEDQGPVLPTEIILRGVAAAATKGK